MEYLNHPRNLVVGVVLGVMGAGVAAAQTREIRGEVTAVSPSSFALRAGDRTLTFMVDGDTLIEAHGAGQRSRQAEKPGGSPIKLSDYVTAGRAVLVRYEEVGGKNQALTIRVIASAGGRSASTDPLKSASGQVISVTASAVTMKQDGKDITYAVDNDTDVLGRGAGRITRAAEGRTSITDLVHSGDAVTISYRDVGGQMTASVVRLRASAR